jgi:hypothetical protein
MDYHWIEEFLYPYKTIENSGFGRIDYERVHKSLAKVNEVTSRWLFLNKKMELF